MIEAVSKNNLSELLPLIRSYQEFYQATDISDNKNESFFSQFGISSPFGCQFAFREAGKIVAFATVYFSFSSTRAEKIAILNDLFTQANYRGQGIGKQLIEHCRSFAGKNGASRLQWLTAADNAPAQKLYDSMNTNKSSWQLYTYNT